MKIDDIDEIVLVGGSTRIPRIQQQLSEVFGGKDLCKTVNPDEAVAYGAAVQGAILNGMRSKATDKLLLLDVTPLSLGIETTGSVMSVIIPRNTPIPCVKTQCYTTEENYQTQVDIGVFEGERTKTTENNELGKFTISGIERAKRGEPKVDVSFSLDSNGILSVKAVDQKTGAEAHIEIESKGRASAEDVERMLADAEKYRKEDEQRLKRAEAQNEVESLLFEAQDMAASSGNNAACIQIEQLASEITEWIEQKGAGATVAEFTAKKNELKFALKKLKL